MAMVNVGCKLPHGLTLTVDNDPKRITLRGSNSSEVVGGYGFTLVDESFYDAWVKQVTPEFEPIKNGFIFKEENSGKAKAKAKERTNEKNGFEQVEPAKEGVEPTPEMKEALAKDDGTGGEPPK